MVLRKWESRSSPPKDKAQANCLGFIVISLCLCVAMSLSPILPIFLSPSLHLSLVLSFLHISIYLKSDNGVSPSGIDTIDEIDSIDAIDEKNGRMGWNILY